eukprot:gene3387-2341_t
MHASRFVGCAFCFLFGDFYDLFDTYMLLLVYKNLCDDDLMLYLLLLMCSIDCFVFVARLWRLMLYMQLQNAELLLCGYITVLMLGVGCRLMGCLQFAVKKDAVQDTLHTILNCDNFVVVHVVVETTSELIVIMCNSDLFIFLIFWYYDAGIFEIAGEFKVNCWCKFMLIILVACVHIVVDVRVLCDVQFLIRNCCGVFAQIVYVVVDAVYEFTLAFAGDERDTPAFYRCYSVLPFANVLFSDNLCCAVSIVLGDACMVALALMDAGLLAVSKRKWAISWMHYFKLCMPTCIMCINCRCLFGICTSFASLVAYGNFATVRYMYILVVNSDLVLIGFVALQTLGTLICGVYRMLCFCGLFNSLEAFNVGFNGCLVC